MATTAALRLLVAALIVGCWVYAVDFAESCGQFSNCEDCHSSSAACGWCSTASSPSFHCVSRTALGNASASCRDCGERRLVREVDPCDDTACLGIDGDPCSGHGTCKCGTCTCESGYSGRACQNCPSKWDDCPSSDGSFGTCCNPAQCLGWPAGCAPCMRNESNATLCDTCPRDTLLVTSDPGQRQSAECVFDSLSISSNLHCSYHVYYWRDETLLALHARVQFKCGPATNRAIFPRGKSSSAAPPTAAPAPTAAASPSPTTTSSTTTTSRPPTGHEKPTEAAQTEKPEGAAKPAAGAGSAVVSGPLEVMVVLCCLWLAGGLP